MLNRTVPWASSLTNNDDSQHIFIYTFVLRLTLFVVETQYYGIDISKSKLQVAYQDATTQLWHDLQIDNEITSITLFLSSIKNLNIHFIYRVRHKYSEN